jgi:hypothetical protein
VSDAAARLSRFRGLVDRDAISRATSRASARPETRPDDVDSGRIPLYVDQSEHRLGNLSNAVYQFFDFFFRRIITFVVTLISDVTKMLNDA